MSDIIIVDSSPRDGPVAVPEIRTPDKANLANSLLQNGLNKLDCVAFTHPRIRPEFADAEEVINAIIKRPDATLVGLAPNEIACRRALNTNVDELGILISGTESFNRSVLGISIKETVKTFPAIIQASLEKEKTVRAYILSAFWCQYEGKVSIRVIAELANRLSFMGIHEIVLVDTPGMANPIQVKETVTALQDIDMEANLAVHFHNTKGLGLVNCLAAYEAGIRIFDTAIGGLSGTPFGAPKMGVGSWNVPTEDLIHLFNEIGVNTGIELDSIIDSVILAQKLTGRQLFGHILKARKTFEFSNFPEPLKLN